VTHNQPNHNILYILYCLVVTNLVISYLVFLFH